MKNTFAKTVCGIAMFLFLPCLSYPETVSLEIYKPTIPVLLHKETNPVIRLDLIRKDRRAYAIENIKLDFTGTTDINDIVTVSVYGSNDKGMLDPKAFESASERTGNNINIEKYIKIDADTVSLWIAVSLKDSIDLTHKITVNCDEIKTSQGKIQIKKTPGNPLKIGVAVRQKMQDNIHTSRIPGLERTKDGTLIAVYDARYESARDLQGDIDICLNRSTDKGITWQQTQKALDMGEWGNLPQKFNGVSDACILVDNVTGEIFIAGLWMHGVLDDKGKWIESLTADSANWEHQWRRKGSQPGWGVKQTAQFLITKSADDGLTWSEPENITSMIKKQEWWLLAPAPGHGITTKDGTLILPTQGRDDTGESFSNITWSKDHGKTWTTANPAFKDVTECNVVELNDGSLMLNMRDNRNRGNTETNGRRISTTTDLGMTWTEHPTSRKALIEPTCMASFHKHKYVDAHGNKTSLLLFANPNSHSIRDSLTLKVSFDDGQTWPQKHWILFDQFRSAGYSSIASVDNNTIGILYESSLADLVYLQFKLEEIVKE